MIRQQRARLIAGAVAIALGASLASAEPAAPGNPAATGVISPDVIASSSDLHPAPPPPARGPELKIAEAMARAALEHCDSMGLHVSAVVIDSGGYVKVSLMSDGALSFTPIFGARKANTALSFRMDSSQVEALAKSDAAVAERLRNEPNLFAAAGALLLKVGDEVIGALAVSGARGDQDESCARAALARYQRRLK